MRSLKIYGVLIISLFFICGTCSKSDDTAGSINDGGGDNYVEPTLDPSGTWIYMTSGSLGAFYGPTNTRPVIRKWISTKTSVCLSSKNGVINTDKNYLSFAFENTDLFTRFCSNKLNPGGKETISISLNKFNRTPGPGNYQMDIDNKEGFVWYDAYKADGSRLDSTRRQGISNSSFNITSMTALPSGGGVSYYKMSGNANLEVMYWKSGTASTTDVHNIQIVFNNVMVTYLQ